MEILEQFMGCDRALLSEIEHKYSVKSFQKGDMVLTQGDDSKDVFILLEGHVRASILSAEGHEIWLGDFGPGDLFGEMATLADMPRTSNITATSRSRLAVFPSHEFLSIMREHGFVGLKVSEILAKRIQATTRRMFELSVLSAPGRIYAEILRLSEQPRTNTSEMRVISPMPRTKDLARRVNSTRETVSRAINYLEKIGLIIREKGKMKIITPDKLGDLIG